MVIKYSAQGANTWVVLGDDTTGTTSPIIVGFIPKMVGIVMVTPLFRAANAQVKARGNRQWEVRGIIEAVHADYDTAADFIRTQAAAIPDYLDLQIIQGSKTNYLTPAGLAAFSPVIVGLSSRIEYIFLGSNYTATSP